MTAVTAPRDRTRRLLLGLSVALFVVSLLLPALRIGGEPTEPGWDLLAIGWLGVASGVVANLSWLANPLLAAGWIAVGLRRRRVGGSLAIAACLAMLLTLAPPGIAWNEGGMPDPVTQVAIGFWLWLASAIVLLGATVTR